MHIQAHLLGTTAEQVSAAIYNEPRKFHTYNRGGWDNRHSPYAAGGIRQT